MWLLLEREDTSPDTPDKDGMTPLLWAVQNRHEYIVRMLLKRKDVTPGAADKAGKTPLSWAAKNGQEYIVKMLLARKDLTPSGTPLPQESSRYPRIVRMISEWEDVTPNTVDNGGRTPPPWAEQRGDVGVVGVLPERRNVTQDKAMTDLISHAALKPTSKKQHKGAIERLLADRGSVLQSADSRGSTDLPPAVSSEPSDALLKGSGGPDIHGKNFPPGEPSHPQYYAALLAFLYLSLHLTLSILLSSLMYHIISSFYLQNRIA